ncbi:MAG TPA: hypothetical protein VGG34_08345 [Opitutaceae bacterium]
MKCTRVICVATNLLVWCNIAFSKDGVIEQFSAPYIDGAYYINWAPFGDSIKGNDYLVGFRLHGGINSDPLKLWFDKKSETLIEVGSISSLNEVLNEIFPDIIGSSDPVSASKIIWAARKWLSNDVVGGECTGFHLWRDSSGNSERIIQRLRRFGLAEAKCRSLDSLKAQATQRINIKQHIWTCVWFEVNREGAIESVTMKGTVGPTEVTALSREILPKYGRIDVRLLKRDILIDTTLSH